MSHPTQNGRPIQMQAPGKHRHMHPPIDKLTETTRASQAVKQTQRCTTSPTTIPKRKTPPQQAEGHHRKATVHAAKRLQNQQHPGQPSQANAKATSHILVYIGMELCQFFIL
ncbi:hypothetical protein AMECASPLE_029734 [Ameca splendens]|uniref:Uncharacterized protein n=1 Tax=Ameca splendens TaxID=208324 RepID=A0ABV0YHD5_9TELE